MSWLARTLVNSLRGEDNQSSEHNTLTKTENAGVQVHTDDEPPSPNRGVKEDLSEFTKTITRQFWGVASFLAPPPDIPPSDRSRVPDTSDPAVVAGLDELEVSESPRMAGIRSDFAELGGRFKSGISILSNTKAVSEISKIASTFLPFGDDDEEEVEDRETGGEVLGITDDVLLFVRNISMHPETWLDFPLIAEDDDPDDFELSDVQQEHALAMERLEPSLAALRIELCPNHMSEGCFWKIYFVLLHSRLNEHDAEVLSTPQIVQARAMLLKDLQGHKKPNTDEPAMSLSSGKANEQYEPAAPDEMSIHIMPVSAIILSEISPPTPPQTMEISASIPAMDIEKEKHAVESTESKIIDKSVIEELPIMPISKVLKADESKHKDEIYEDDWLEDETGEANSSGENAVPLGNDEDVSFSDLEEDDSSMGTKTKVVPKSIPSQVKESRGWVQLDKNKDDWLNVDEIDVE